MPVQPGDETILRSWPQTSRWYLVVQQPERWEGSLYGEEFSWYCQVSTTPTDDPVIDLDVNNGGPAADLLDAMTILIGTTPGAWDRGIFYVRGDQSVSSGTVSLDVCPTSEMKTVIAGDYVTVLDEFRLWARFPQVTVSGSTINWFKYWTITYASLGGSAADRREASLPPVPIMGPHAVKFVGDDPVYVDFTWANSYPTYPGASATTWTATGEKASGAWASALENPPPQRYESTDISGLAGYRVTLEVGTDQNDSPVAFRRGVRYVFTLRRPGDRRAGDPVNAEPIINFGITPPQGSFSRGGWSTQIRVFGSDASENVFLPGALVIVFAEDQYPADVSYIGASENNSVGPIRDRENIVLVGRIADGSIRQDDEHGDVTFDVVSLAELSQKCPLYPIPIENDNGATEWYGCPDLTLSRAMWHYLCWHSTLPLIADVYLYDRDVDSTPQVTAEDFEAGDIYRHIDSFANERRFGRFLADRYGRTAVQYDQQINAPKTAPTLWTLEDGDRLEEIRTREIAEKPLSLFVGGGVVYSVGLQTPYLSNAPGFVSGYRGSQEERTALAITSQADLNTLTGRWYANRNSSYPEWAIQMAGNFRVGDIWPQEYVRVPYLYTERREFTDLWLLLREIEYSYDPARGFVMTNWACERETDGPDGVTVEIPAELPPYKPPPIPKNRPRRPSTPGTGSGTQDLGRRMASTKDGIAVTDNIGANPPAWYLVSPPSGLGWCYLMKRDPWHWWTTTAEKKLWGVFLSGSYPSELYYMDDFPYGAWVHSFTAGGSRPHVCDLQGSIEREDTLYMLRYAKTWGTSGGNLYVHRTEDGGASWAQLIDLGERGGQTYWPILGHKLSIDQHSNAQTQHAVGNDLHSTKYGARTFNEWAVATLDTSYPQHPFQLGQPYVDPSWDGSFLITLATTSRVLYYSEDTGNNWTNVASAGNPYAISSFDGAVGYITILVSGAIKHTIDKGVTWTTWATIPAGVYSYVMLTEYGEDGWPLSVLVHSVTDNKVYLVTPSGYQDKTGNILSISPTLNNEYITRFERDTVGSA